MSLVPANGNASTVNQAVFLPSEASEGSTIPTISEITPAERSVLAALRSCEGGQAAVGRLVAHPCRIRRRVLNEVLIRKCLQLLTGRGLVRVTSMTDAGEIESAAVVGVSDDMFKCLLPSTLSSGTFTPGTEENSDPLVCVGCGCTKAVHAVVIKSAQRICFVPDQASALRRAVAEIPQPNPPTADIGGSLTIGGELSEKTPHQTNADARGDTPSTSDTSGVSAAADLQLQRSPADAVAAAAYDFCRRVLGSNSAWMIAYFPPFVTLRALADAWGKEHGSPPLPDLNGEGGERVG